MSYPFGPNRGPIYVEVEVSGPSGRSNLRLLLDTGGLVALVLMSGCHWSYPTSAFSVAEGALVGYDQWHPRAAKPAVEFRAR
jgi:hypothetical protein